MAISANVPKLAADMTQLAEDLRTVYFKAKDVYNRYWDTSANTEIGALAADGTAVPGTSFDKATFTNMITVADQLIKFMENQAVAQSTYRITINKVAALK